MSNGLKAILGIGAVALLLKAWSDSKALTDKLGKASQVPGGTVSVGGTTLPTPTPKMSGVPLDSSTLAGGGGVLVNPALGYEQGFWGPDGPPYIEGDTGFRPDYSA